MGPTWGPSGADRTQVGPMLAPWTLLSGILYCNGPMFTAAQPTVTSYPTLVIIQCVDVNENSSSQMSSCIFCYRHGRYFFCFTLTYRHHLVILTLNVLRQYFDVDISLGSNYKLFFCEHNLFLSHEVSPVRNETSIIYWKRQMSWSC